VAGAAKAAAVGGSALAKPAGSAVVAALVSSTGAKLVAPLALAAAVGTTWHALAPSSTAPPPAAIASAPVGRRPSPSIVPASPPGRTAVAPAPAGAAEEATPPGDAPPAVAAPADVAPASAPPAPPVVASGPPATPSNDALAATARAGGESRATPVGRAPGDRTSPPGGGTTTDARAGDSADRAAARAMVAGEATAAGGPEAARAARTGEATAAGGPEASPRGAPPSPPERHGPPEAAPAPVPSAAAPPRAATPALREQLELLARAQRALRDGRAREALELLDSQRATLASSALGEEYAAARAVALCDVGRREEARAAARAFLRSFPRSPLTPRVRAVCASER
jgi:hypothetical protein